MSGEFEAPLPLEEEPQQKNNTVLIIAIVLVVLLFLCCCCVVESFAIWLWNNGDEIFNLTSQILIQTLV